MSSLEIEMVTFSGCLVSCHVPPDKKGLKLITGACASASELATNG